MEAQKTKVLLVEDNDLDQMAFIRMVKNEGLAYDYTIAGSVEEGKAQLANGDFDIVITDYSLGDGTGIEIITANKNAPVIMTTGEGDEMLAVKAIKAGAYDYLTKDEGRNYLRLLPITVENAIRQYLAMKKLAEYEKTNEMLFWVASETDNAVVISNEQGYCEWVNDGFTRMSGYSIEDIKDTRGEVFRHLAAADLPDGDDILEEVIEKKQRKLYEAKRRKKDGKEYWTLTNLIPILYDDGRIHKIASVHSDITHRKETEAALQLAKERAEQSEKTKEKFLANMSHEIRTPMNAIIGFTNLLLKTELNEEQADFVKSIEGSGKNLLVIINDILDISKIEAGMLRFEHINFSLREAVESVTKMLAPKAADKKLGFVTEIDPTLPDWLMGDPVRLNQILINLLNNAIKFTAEGSVTLKVSRQSGEEDSIVLDFEVIDTGIGIAADKVESVFESFSQASSDTTRIFGGTGLGLTIVKRLIEMQEGAIKVTSQIGTGSNFSFYLPFDLSSAEQAAKAEQARVSGDIQPDDLGPLKILLAEDNLVNQKLATRVLRDFGFETDVADNGKIAVEKLQNNDYDLILMDIQMPEMDGYETTQHIRSKLGAPKNAIPIVAMTANAMVGEKDKCREMGMNDYVPKPFDTQHLLRVIAGLVLPEQPAHIPANGPAEKPGPATAAVAPALPEVMYVDMSQLDLLSGGDMEFKAEIIETSITQIGETADAIREATAAENWERLKAQAHKLRSTCSLIGGMSVSKQLEKIEDTVLNNVGMEELPSLVDNFLDQLPSFLKGLQAELDKIG